MRSLLFIAMVAILTACQAGSRTGEERLTKTLTDLILHREQFGRATAPDSVALYRAQVDSILQQQGFTREEFVASFLEMIESPDRFDPLFKRLFSDLQQSSP